MKQPNLHVEEFLNYYCSFKQEPGYAVLLKGRWGAGKTWFINRTLELLKKQGGRHLYVSLYGVNSFEEIENEFFKQLHPLLSSKSMGLAGKIAKGLLRTTLKIDLDRDGKSDISVSSQVPEIQLPEYLTNTSDFVIVFDDVERASIKLESLLGYINHYVEHQGHKVVMLANEQEIFDQQEVNNDFKLSYRRIKEKLIGKTFEIEPDLQGALKSFIEEIATKKVKELYESNNDVISEMYEKSEYKNLRHLKQALWDFERLYTFIGSQAAGKNDLLLHLLKIFQLLSFEIKSGNILPTDISGFQKGYALSVVNRISKKDDITLYDRLAKKYRNINLHDLLIEESIWIDFFNKGGCSKDAMQESLEKSTYFRDENTPDWVRLWRSMELTDDEFEKALSSVQCDFNQKKIMEVGILKHVVGIFLWLSRINLISKPRREILEHGRSYADHLMKEGMLTKENSDWLRFRGNEAWGGLGFHEVDSEEFKDLSKYIDQLREQAVINEYPEMGKELLSNISDDPDLFYRKVVLCNHPDNVYFEIPIFKYINPKLFVEAFVNAKPNARNTVCYAFSERYKFSNYNEALSPELDWLKNVIFLMEEKRQLLNGKISGYQLQSDIDNYFKAAAEALEKSTSGGSR